MIEMERERNMWMSPGRSGGKKEMANGEHYNSGDGPNFKKDYRFLRGTKIG